MRHHRERHRSARIGWLRAAVLGADDGIVSTASLLIGVAAAGTSRGQILLAGIAGLVAGAMSMAAGEYVSVSSQADTDEADLARERRELATDRPSERAELANIYVARGVQPALAQEVADQLMAHDALGAHARDELGISDHQRARPMQAALASAAAFSVGAAMPLLVMLLAPSSLLTAALATTSLAFLATLGWLAARIGGARTMRAALRVTFWGALAMALTYAAGALFGAVV
jgi:VIT1/CCC1 family predicted Fe2+/Mn2+ transporter